MAKNMWKEILDALESVVSRPNFITWLKPTGLLEDGPGQYSITVPNPYAKSWIESNVLAQIEELLRQRDADLQHLRVIVHKAPKASLDDLPLLGSTTEEVSPDQPVKESAPPAENPFNSKYTFETLIVGNHNRLAFAAAQAVAERPGEAYNPLFIYGGVGLGKTHLMQAVGNQIFKNNPKKKINYTSCETFTSEFIEALQNKTINEFKRRYRTVDVLLIDDIQFLANKEGTQEEFFHTFNILHQANRQIILTSDRMPKEIGDLEERLTSRFGWGLVADIQTPNFETRVAILQAKAKQMGFVADPEVFEHIASQVTANVRELEGSLIKLATTAKIEEQQITLELAKQVLTGHLGHNDSNLSTKKIIREVCEHFGVESGLILGSKRQKELVYPRQITMYLLRELMKQSYPQIGEVLGGKDHTTVMHGVEKISKLLKIQPEVESDVKQIKAKLRG